MARPFAEVASELLWARLGAVDDALVTLDDAGLARATGGLCTTARDLARVGQLVVDGGVRDAERIVPAAWIDDLATGGDRAAWREREWARLFGSREVAHRSGWYASSDEPAMLFAMGIHGQNLFVDRAHRLVVAKLSSQDWFDIPAVMLTHCAVGVMRGMLLRG